MAFGWIDALMPSALETFRTKSIIAWLLSEDLPAASATRSFWADAFPFVRGYDLDHTLVKWQSFNVHVAFPRPRFMMKMGVTGQSVLFSGIVAKTLSITRRANSCHQTGETP